MARFFFIGLSILASGLAASCAPLGSSDFPSVSLAPSAPLTSSRHFRRAINAAPGSKQIERVRIEYLLERVSKSPYNFIRNGSRYSGVRAWVHLKWKYFRNLGRVETAEEFIERVATRSKTSGAVYLIEMPDRKRYPLKNFFLRELSLFDEAVKKRQTAKPPKTT